MVEESRTQTPPGAGSAGTVSWQARVESAFEQWGRVVIRHRWPALISSLLVTGWLLSYLPGLVVDNSTESFLLPDDPAVIGYNASRDQFGRDDRILVAISAPDLFAVDFLERLRALHDAIEEEVPYVEHVDSLLNARVTRGDEAGLIVEELVEEWPTPLAELERKRAFAYANPVYENTLISSDRGLTSISITPSTYSAVESPGDELGGFEETDIAAEAAANGDSKSAATGPVYLTALESDELMVKLFEIVSRFEDDDFEIHVAGAIPMTHRINVGMMRDLSTMMPLTLLLMTIVLALLFRRVGGVVLPLAIVVLSLTATIGTMIFLGIPGSTAVQILPVFLLTVGVCDAVHILALAYRYRMEGRGKEDSIALAMGHAGLAVLMTSITTAAGMASFITAEMAAVMHLWNSGAHRNRTRVRLHDGAAPGAARDLSAARADARPHRSRKIPVRVVPRRRRAVRLPESAARPAADEPARRGSVSSGRCRFASRTTACLGFRKTTSTSWR